MSALMLTCIASCAAAEDRTPTDAELKTAYCIPLLQWEVEIARVATDTDDDHWRHSPPSPELRDQVARKSADLHRRRAAMESTLGRLQAFLGQRIKSLDRSALAAAGSRGKADLDELQAQQPRCRGQCGPESSDAAADENATACLESCADQQLAARLKACNAPSWLPF